MKNLIRAGLVRLFRSKVLYITAILTALSTFMATRSGDGLYWGADGPNIIDYDVIDWLPFISFSVVVVTCLYCDSDYRSGAVRNKIVVGLTKAKIYLSNLVVCFVGGVICFAAGCAMIAVTAAVQHRIWLSSFVETLYLLLAVFIIIACSAAIALFFAMLIQTAAVGSVITLVILIVSLFFSAYVGMRLGEVKYRIVWGDNDKWFEEIIEDIDNYDERVEAALEYGYAVPNPYYVGGVKRLAYGVVAYLLPGGQATMLRDVVGDAIRDGKAVEPVTPIFPLAVSAAFSASLTALGVVLFSRKNIN